LQYERSRVTIFTGSDHAGHALRVRIVEHLRARAVEVKDLGPASTESTDYPDWAAKVGRAVRETVGAMGVLTCGSGIGVCIAANKIGGIRAALAWNVESARLSRAHNDANVLCLGARLVDEADALAIVDAWMTAPFEGGRHSERVAKITALEHEERNETEPAGRTGNGAKTT
jgi:ribose 5-phosphate isomerase B